jgi:hypothetical protein
MADTGAVPRRLFPFLTEELSRCEVARLAWFALTLLESFVVLVSLAQVARLCQMLPVEQSATYPERVRSIDNPRQDLQ